MKIIPEDNKPPPPPPSELSLKLLEYCEKAYLRGLSPQEIYKALHSPIFIKNKKKDKQFLKISLIILLIATVLSGYFFLSSSKSFLKERRCLLPSHPLLMEIVRPIANCAFCRDGKVSEFKGSVDPSVFKTLCYSSRPIIVRKGAFNKSLLEGGFFSPLSFERLKEIFEEEVGGIDTVSNECQFLPFRSPFSSLRDAFQKIPKMVEWGEPWYIGWSNCHPGVASKLRALVPRPTFLPEESGVSAIDWIFIGSPGLGAALHIDYVRRPSWQAQLSGVKTWEVIPPPECEGVCPPSLKFTIHPGDLLFLETNIWYHQTFIEGDQLSISIGSEYD